MFHKNILKRFDRFNFKCNYILDEQVHTKSLVLNTSSSKKNWKINLRIHLHPGLFKGYFQASLIDLFKKSRPQLFMNFNCYTNDSFS